MYRVIKNDIAFLIDDDEQAKQYIREGCDVLRVTKIVLNDQNELDEEILTSSSNIL